MTDKPVLYTIDGTPVAYPYNIPEPTQEKPETPGIETPFTTNTTLVFKCNEYTVRSKPYKHYYMNKILEKTGIHRVTDKKSRKQLSEYYLEEIQISKEENIPQEEINVYTRGVTTNDWLQTVIPQTTFILCTQYGDRLSIPARALFEQNIFSKYAYITTTAYKPDFIKTVISSLTEFLLLTINRVYVEYGQELYNFLHGQELDSKPLHVDVEIIRDEENNTYTVIGKYYDQRTLEKIPEAEIKYILDEINEETETNTESIINKEYVLGDDNEDHTLKLCITAEGYDQYCENMQLVRRQQTSTNILQDVFTTNPGGEISVDVEVEDDTGEPVPNGRVEFYSNEEKTSIEDIIEENEEDDDNS